MRRLATALTLLGSLCVGYAGQVVTPAAQTSPPWLPRDGGRPPRAGQPVDARRPTIPLAWTYVRSRLPRDVTVLRPGWLPARFRTAPVIWPGSVQNSRVFGTTYNVGYRSIRGDVVQFALGSVNSGPPDTQERIRVRGVQGTLATSSNWPPIGVYWHERSRFYAIQAHGITRAEMLHIVADLTPVPTAP